MIRVAQAGSDERYVFNGGKAGDQRKTAVDGNGCFSGELSVLPWYNKPWDYLIRPNSETVAETMAATAEAICRNKNVGYDQSQDETLWDAIEKLGWKQSSISKLPLCETDCCRLVDVEIRMAGITNIPNLRHKYTGNIRKALEQSGHFTVYDEKGIAQTETHLKRGDLLLQEGHHIVTVLDTAPSKGAQYKIVNCVACHLRTSGSTAGAHLAYLHPGDIVSLHGWSPSGWGKVTTISGTTGYVSPKYLQPVREFKATEKLWLRSGAGTNNEGIIVIPKGTKVPGTGQAVKVSGTTWYGVMYSGYSGFSSGKYLKPL